MWQVSSTDFPGHRPGEEAAWDLEAFRDNLSVEIHQLDELEMEFDLVGVDASIANAFRRILLAEVPTMAIETVYMYNNTSVIQDEVLSHRLGLIPINADPTRFGWQNSMSCYSKTDAGQMVQTESVWPLTLTHLHSSSTSNVRKIIPLRQRRATHTEHSNTQTVCPARLIGAHAILVYSRDIQWIPKGKQSVWFEHTPIKSVHDNILIAKLRPGQVEHCINTADYKEIELEMHAVKGIGKDHAKFSPVGKPLCSGFI